MVDLEDERDAVRVAARDRAEAAQRAGDGVAPALDRQLHDLLRVEVVGVGRERRRGGVLDPLVHRQDREVAGPGEPPVRVQALEIAQHPRMPVRRTEHGIDVVRARGPDARGRDAVADVGEQIVGLGAEEFADRFERAHRVPPRGIRGGRIVPRTARRGVLPRRVDRAPIPTSDGRRARGPGSGLRGARDLGEVRAQADPLRRARRPPGEGLARRSSRPGGKPAAPAGGKPALDPASERQRTQRVGHGNAGARERLAQPLVGERRTPLRPPQQQQGRAEAGQDQRRQHPGPRRARRRRLGSGAASPGRGVAGGSARRPAPRPAPGAGAGATTSRGSLPGRRPGPRSRRRSPTGPSGRRARPRLGARSSAAHSMPGSAARRPASDRTRSSRAREARPRPRRGRWTGARRSRPPRGCTRHRKKPVTRRAGISWERSSSTIAEAKYSQCPRRSRKRKSWIGEAPPRPRNSVE